MKTTLRRLSLFLTIVFLASHLLLISDAFAKRGSSRSFSSRSKSRSTSRSRKTSKGRSFTSKKKTNSYTSRSKTRSKKGSIFNSRSKKTSRGTSLAQAAKKADSKSKFTTSVKGQQTSKTYRQVVTENKPLKDSLTTKNMQTRNKRRYAFSESHKPINIYYGYTPHVIYSDPYDNLFFRYVTIDWMYHHWYSIDRSRFDEARLRELEDKIEQMEEEGIERDPNYVMPGVDPDLQYSNEELENLQEAKDVIDLEAEQEEGGRGFGWLTVFLVGIVIVGGVYFVAVRRF